MGLKLSDLNSKDYQFVDEPGKAQLKLSGLKPADYQFVEPPHPSQLESVARGLAKGGSLGLEPFAVGLGGAIGNAAGKIGVDKVESPHPDVQAKLDEIAEHAPTANEIFNKSKKEEDTANDQAAEENPMSYYAGEFGPSAYKAAPALLAAGKQLPVASLVKGMVTAHLGLPGKLLVAGAEKAGDLIWNPVAKRVAQNMAALGAQSAAPVAAQAIESAAAPIAESVGPAVKDAIMKRRFDPFTKKFLD